jgi:hypothetical protein
MEVKELVSRLSAALSERKELRAGDCLSLALLRAQIGKLLGFPDDDDGDDAPA